MIQTTIRIDDELHEDLRQSAFKKKISINQEIILRLSDHKKMVERIKHLIDLDECRKCDEEWRDTDV